jgi:outer membrane protein OmpA-like peptidoglycan-associated protein
MGYCTGDLKVILKRVLTSCGLVTGGSTRGCQPLQARQVASMSGGDFNALFSPLSDRAAIIQFDKDSADLDAAGADLLEKAFADRRGASYFFVVSRASPEGSAEHNRDLSRRRGTVVLDHIRAAFQDPDIDQEVGLLWLGEEFAQLDQQFCQWKRSRPEAACSSAELNRSSFIAWIDCRL